MTKTAHRDERPPARGSLFPRQRTRLAAALVSLLTLLQTTAPALAAGGDHHAFRWNVEGFFIINFLVMVALLVWLLRKPLARMVTSRRKQVVRELEVAARAIRDAEYSAARGDRNLMSLDDDVRQILLAAKEEGEAKRKRLIAEGEAAAQKLMEDAEQRVAWREQTLATELRVAMAERAVATAEHELRERDLTGTSHELAIREFLTKLENLTSAERQRLRGALSNPSAERARREELLRAILAPLRGVHTSSRDLLRVLNRGQQTDLIEAALREIVSIADERQGRVRVKVESAFALPTDEQEQIRAALERVVQQPVVCDFDNKPSLLGGVVVEIGHTILDGSLRTQLDRMRAHLLTEH